MREPNTRPTTASVPECLARQVGERRVDREALLRLMEAATGEPVVMWGAAIVGLGRHAYPDSAGKPFEWPIIGALPRKRVVVVREPSRRVSCAPRPRMSLNGGFSLLLQCSRGAHFRVDFALFCARLITPFPRGARFS